MAKLKRPAKEDNRPAKEPWGPGMLLLAGLVLGGLAAYCFADLFIRGMPEQWEQEGHGWYVPLNWVIMLVSVAGMVYAFVLAGVRSKKRAAGGQ
jgi:hypothetical protein